MKDNPVSEADIQSMLRRLPDRQPPENLQQQIMQALPTRRESAGRRLKKCLTDFFTTPASVGPVLALASLALAFYGGMQIDTFLMGSDSQQSIAIEPKTIKPESNAEASFYLGRSLLASGEADKALEALKRATFLQPDNPQYALWLGAAYYALGNVDNERKTYQQLIDRRPDYVPARLNLAHNFLQNGLPVQAGQLYEQVLQAAPKEKSALYNRALALHLQGDKTAETKAWKDFLYQYRTGLWAERALGHLYQLGNYDFRSYLIGYRSIIINQHLLLGPPGPRQDFELNLLADQLTGQNQNTLNIVVYRLDNVSQAKTNAQTIRKALISRLPKASDNTVRISWFGKAEARTLPSQDKIHLPEGVLIFSTSNTTIKEERI